MKLIFAGTPEVAVPSFEAILNSGRHEVQAVLTRPDAPTGRGRKLSRSPIAQAAGSAGIEVLTPRSLKDPEISARLTALAPDVAPVVAYGNLVPPALLRLPRHGWINLHFSLLPAWRGASPVNAAIAAGDDITGASTFLLEEGLDTGPVFGTVTEVISPSDTAGALLDRLAGSGAELLLATLDGIEAGDLTPVAQGSSNISYAGKLDSGQSRIQWTSPALAIDRHIRSLTPVPGAWTTFEDERVKIGEARLIGEDSDNLPEDVIKLSPGSLGWTKKKLYVGTGNGIIELAQLQPPGKKMMSAMDWVRGARLEPGVSFS